MTNLSTTIDAYGLLCTQIAELERQKKAMKEAFADLPKGTHEGNLFNLNVAEFSVEKIDWQAIAEKVGYSSQLKTAHTTTRDDRRLTAKVNANKVLTAA
jgi:hypothetical protein